jgi:capsule biosynthesis phosphatase
MKHIILCGGIGKRNNNYSLPKPLNYINGRHLIEYIIESIPDNEIYIIYNYELDNYNFKEIIINKFKLKQFYFSTVDYLTRGPVETAYVGIKKFNINDDDNILFIDNDNLHKYPKFKNFSNNFICYGINYIHQNYSFITIFNDKVTNIEEKNKISDNYCCGLYGFKNKQVFVDLAKELINSNLKVKNEFYFSQLYKLLLQNNQIIEPVHIKDTMHLGTFEEIIEHKDYFQNNNKLRICFDLDNTLVTYPTIPGDYSSVLPISKSIELLKKFKNDGHTIIIYTARRMLTHGGDIGKVMKDIALVTLETLNKLDIEYDEIIFGKPIADIYIDDRAINLYNNEISFFGFFSEKIDKFINKIDNNKYNKIVKLNNTIIKTGPEKFIKGELYFYQNIPTEFKHYFPNLINYKKMDNSIEITIEYINGIPLYFLYKHKTLTTKIIDDLFKILKELHTYNSHIGDDITTLIKKNYFNKLEDRFNIFDYDFLDANQVYDEIINGLKINYDPQIVSIVHGDFWFSNIILTYSDSYKFVDMKGQIYGMTTLSGDKYYDYGKLYQSILGYDLILHNDEIDYDYICEIKTYFLYKCEQENLNLNYLKYVTKSLIFGTFHFLKIDDPKEKIWTFLKTI